MRLNSGGFQFAVAMAINDRSQIAGYGSTGLGVIHALLWRLSDGTVETATVPGGATPANSGVIARRTVAAGPAGCLADPTAMRSKVRLAECVMARRQ